jgi:hypothetical protein
MSESEDEGDKVGRDGLTAEDKEQLNKIEANDHKVDKAEKRRKRMESAGVKMGDADADSELSDDKQDDDGSGEDEAEKGKDKKKAIEHKPIKKTDEQIKKSQFLGEKFGHYKIGCYMRIELKVDKAISRKIEPEYPVVLCSLK